MKIKDLITELSKFDKETEVGGVVVSYTEHGTHCGDYEFGCYCSSEDHEFTNLTVVKEEKFGKGKDRGQFLEKIWIRGDL